MAFGIGASMHLYTMVTNGFISVLFMICGMT